PVPSVRVSPPRVGESPVSFECRVEKIVPLGEGGGAGNLDVCRVVLMHISEDVLDEKRMIDPRKLDAVARLGDNWYSRITPESLFIVPKPLRTIGIGVDALPEEIRKSTVLTGNDLAKLANVERVPDPGDTQGFEGDVNARHRAARHLSEKNAVEVAWTVLLSPQRQRHNCRKTGRTAMTPSYRESQTIPYFRDLCYSGSGSRLLSVTG